MASSCCKLSIRDLKNQSRNIKDVLFRSVQLQKYGIAGKSRSRWGKICDISTEKCYIRNPASEYTDELFSSCSPCLGQESIRLRYKDEDGDFVNISPDDPFAFSEMLRMAKQVGDRDYKKIYIKAHEVNSPVPQKMRRLDSGGLSTSAAFSGGELEPKQLTYRALAPVATSTAQTTSSTEAREKSQLDLKEEELKENLAVLQVQLSTAREELNNLKQQDKQFLLLSSIRTHMCTVCHVAGHTKTTCKNEHCTNISCCKV